MEAGCAPESQLIATVAHELRNPLASLRLSLDMLVYDFDDLPIDSVLELIQRAQRSVGWLYSLTENLTCGFGDLSLQRVDLADCIREACHLVAAALQIRNQAVRVLGPARALVTADPVRLIQVLANLLSNASRYSVDGDEFVVDVVALGEWVTVSVTDHGPGISQEDQRRVFDAFVRAPGAGSGGIGLGLSIVRDLVRRMGGEVGVSSAPGEGATFWFTLKSDSPAHR